MRVIVKQRGDSAAVRIPSGIMQAARLNLDETVAGRYVPEAGHEQARHSPAAVISPAAYNGKTSLMVCCPMTTQVRG